MEDNLERWWIDTSDSVRYTSWDSRIPLNVDYVGDMATELDLAYGESVLLAVF